MNGPHVKYRQHQPLVRDISTQVVSGVTIAALDLQEAAEAVASLVGDTVGHAVYTCNVDHLMMLREDGSFARAYANASLVTADGAPVVALARLLGGPVSRRVTGADLVPALAAVAAARGLRLALVGGKEGVAARAAERLAARWPGLAVVALPPPPFGFVIGGPEDEVLLRQLERVGPAIVIVCLGAPKQELWIERHRRRLSGTALLGAGASLDFIAGEQTRAPAVWQRLGLEFLWRLVTDWPRLWRRYLLRDSRFVFVAGKELLRRATSSPSPVTTVLPQGRVDQVASADPDVLRQRPNDAA